MIVEVKLQCDSPEQLKMFHEKLERVGWSPYRFHGQNELVVRFDEEQTHDRVLTEVFLNRMFMDLAKDVL